jgi:hypothetical protein
MYLRPFPDSPGLTWVHAYHDSYEYYGFGCSPVTVAVCTGRIARHSAVALLLLLYVQAE